MREITKEALKAKLDKNHDFKLVMVLGDWQYRAKHITGSINISSPDDSRVQELSKDEEIVLYCSDKACVASRYAYHMMEQDGFTNVHRYAGGIAEWEDAGFPLVGEMV